MNEKTLFQWIKEDKVWYYETVDNEHGIVIASTAKEAEEKVNSAYEIKRHLTGYCKVYGCGDERLFSNEPDVMELP